MRLSNGEVSLRTGNVPRRGNWGATLEPGESVTVPGGMLDLGTLYEK